MKINSLIFIIGLIFLHVFLKSAELKFDAEMQAKFDKDLYDAMITIDIEKARESINSGANVNFSIEADTPLMLAINAVSNREELNKKIIIIDMLLAAGADIDALDCYKYDVLTKTASMAHYRPLNLEIIKHLLEKGADYNLEIAFLKSFLDYTNENPAINQVLNKFLGTKRLSIIAKISSFLSNDTAGIIARYCY